MSETTETLSIADLRCFLEIARAASITKAARVLGVPKAGVSKSLARIERKLGAKLFERSTRRIAITPVGLVLQRRAAGILADMESLGAELRRDEREAQGALVIAAPPELGGWLTEHLVPAYLERYPGVRIAMRLDYAMHDLFDPEIDLAFRVGVVEDENMIARPVGTCYRILIASPSFVSRVPLPNLAALAKAPCLAFSERADPVTWTLTDGHDVQALAVDGALAVRSFWALVTAARAGLGVAQVPDFVARPALESGELVHVLPAWRSPAIEMYVVHRVGHQRIRRVGALLELLRERPELVPTTGARVLSGELRSRVSRVSRTASPAEARVSRS